MLTALATQPPSINHSPPVLYPVNATMDAHLFYNTERGPVIWPHPIFCSLLFSQLVLSPLDVFLVKNNYALVHIGIFNPRPARHVDGSLIKPVRWSNHAYGKAMDFKGIITDNGAGEFIEYKKLKSTNNPIIAVINDIREDIVKAHYQPEIVDEHSWLHIGIFQHL